MGVGVESLDMPTFCRQIHCHVQSAADEANEKNELFNLTMILSRCKDCKIYLLNDYLEKEGYVVVRRVKH